APAARLAPAVAQAVDPRFPEGIPEHRAAVAARAGQQRRIAPVNAVRGKERREAVRALHRASSRAGAEHLEAALRILFLQVEPDRRRIAVAALDDVRARLHVE